MPGPSRDIVRIDYQEGHRTEKMMGADLVNQIVALMTPAGPTMAEMLLERAADKLDRWRAHCKLNSKLRPSE